MVCQRIATAGPARQFLERETSRSELSSPYKALRRASRRQEALRRLGIPSSTDSCSYESGCGSSREGDEQGSEAWEEDQTGPESAAADWNYIATGRTTTIEHRGPQAAG
ncbi:hypothetical protein PtB15_8B438 [Puccinia triticina]|nr:hypothetical protein PtB15_8B438 [Puccinia triticina]